jgi:hypothetical protein
MKCRQWFIGVMVICQVITLNIPVPVAIYDPYSFMGVMQTPLSACVIYRKGLF